ncbi:hypothetical protein [Nocardia thailandica]
MDIHEELARYREQQREAAIGEEEADRARLRERAEAQAQAHQNLFAIFRNQGIAPRPLYVYVNSKKKRWSTQYTSIYRHIGDGWHIYHKDDFDGESFDIVLTTEGVEHIAFKRMSPNKPDTIGIDHGPGWAVQPCKHLVDPRNHKFLRECRHNEACIPPVGDSFIAYASAAVDLNLETTL